MGERQTIVVAGAGIGGLTAALAIADAGFRVVDRRTVRRAARDRRRHPAFAQCRPRPCRRSASKTRSPRPPSSRRRSTCGTAPPASRSCPSPSRRSPPATASPIASSTAPTSRRSLRPLSVAAADIRLILGARIDDLLARDDALFVRARRTDGNEVLTAAGIVGADGVWSETRARLTGAPPATPTGRTAWRTVIPIDNAPPTLADRPRRPLARPERASRPLPGRPRRRDQRRCHRRGGLRQAGLGGAGQLPLAWRSALATGAPRSARWSARRCPGRNSRSTSSIRPVPGSRAGPPSSATPPTPWCRSSPRARRWRSRTPPSSAGRLPATPGDVPAAFAAYAAERKPRVARVWKAARRTGEHYHQGGFLASMRDFILAHRRTGTAARPERLDLPVDTKGG